MRLDNKDKLSLPSVVLHWLVALSVMGMLAFGFYITYTQSWSQMGLHKSLGILILALALIRVAWRIKNGWPQLLDQSNRLEALGAQLAHWCLIVASVLMPFSGIVASIASGRGLTVFGWNLIASIPDPDRPGKFIAYSQSLAHFCGQVHEITAYALAGLIILHIAAAFKRQWFTKDQTLDRMLGRSIGER